jgi:hypothetical protein
MPKKRKNIFRTGARLPNTTLKLGSFTVEKAMHCNGKDNALHQHMQCIASGNGRHCIKQHEGTQACTTTKALDFRKTLERANPSQGG